MNPSGAEAEALAAALLESHGCVVRARNFRCRMGEIDLVVDDAGTLVFVEVRKRAHSRFGGAGESITAAKQARLVAAARAYLSRLATEPPCRFDAVLVDGRQQARWIRDAFGT